MKKMIVRFAAVLMLASLVLAVGCGEKEVIDWQARVGSYAYSDAVKDFGEPMTCQPQPDGGRICAWDVSESFKYRDTVVMSFDPADMLLTFEEKKL